MLPTNKPTKPKSVMFILNYLVPTDMSSTISAKIATKVVVEIDTKAVVELEFMEAMMTNPMNLVKV